MNIGLVNAFLAHETSDNSETLLKKNIQQLNTELLKLDRERQEQVKLLTSIEQHYLKLMGAFENQLILAEQLALSKGLVPLERSTEEAEATETTEAMEPAR